MGVSTNAIALTGEVLRYIPQRPPMVMVDAFYSISEDGNVVTTGLTILNENIFTSEGLFREGGILEHVAQSAALRMGYLSCLHGEKVKLGYIGSFDKVRVESLPSIGQELRTTLTVDCDMGALVMLSFITMSGGKTIAEGRIKVALKE